MSVSKQCVSSTFSSHPLLSPERDLIEEISWRSFRHHDLVGLNCLVFMAFAGYCSVTYQGSAGVNIWPRSTWKLLFALWFEKNWQQALTFYHFNFKFIPVGSGKLIEFHWSHFFLGHLSCPNWWDEQYSGIVLDGQGLIRQEEESKIPNLYISILLNNASVWLCPVKLACLVNVLPIQFSCSVLSYSLWPHGLQHARLSCPSPTPRTHSNSCPLSQWWHPTISSSVVPFSCCL